MYDELYDLGIIGLIKAVDTWKENKSTFGSYAYVCIRNEILMQMRKQKFSPISLETSICDNLKLEDVIEDNFNIEENVIKNEEKTLLKKGLNMLSDKERDLIIKYFGLGTSRKYTQIELAKIHNCGQTYISKLIQKALEKLKRAVNT